ncbi:MAG: hypothetical protein GX804_03200 [Lentisphaerae bacterium]|jgi:hypothetical protein|nr:hypothetical protein [Lentisphaerota bacterium]
MKTLANALRFAWRALKLNSFLATKEQQVVAILLLLFMILILIRSLI